METIKIIKIIDLLNKIANGEEVPEKIKYNDNVFRKCDIGDDYFNDASYDWLFKDIFDTSMLNDEVEIIKEETKPLTKQDIEALGYACGEIQKCFTNGWNKSLENKQFKEDKEIEKLNFNQDWKNGLCISYEYKLVDKVNELIDKVNSLGERND